MKKVVPLTIVAAFLELLTATGAQAQLRRHIAAVYTPRATHISRPSRTVRQVRPVRTTRLRRDRIVEHSARMRVHERLVRTSVSRYPSVPVVRVADPVVSGVVVSGIPAPVAGSPRHGVTSVADAPIYFGPSTDSKLEKRLALGKGINKIIAEQNGFFEIIQYNGRHTFIPMDCVRIEGDGFAGAR